MKQAIEPLEKTAPGLWNEHNYYEGELATAKNRQQTVHESAVLKGRKRFVPGRGVCRYQLPLSAAKYCLPLLQIEFRAAAEFFKRMKGIIDLLITK